MAESPDVRASDADRDRVAEVLRHAAGEGRITVDELDERVDAAFAARTHGDLARLTADLPQTVHTAAAPALPVRPGDGGRRWLISIMSGRDQRGHWRVGERMTSLNVMGGSDLDLNDVELSAYETTIHVISIMGGATVRVPEGLDVRVSEFAFMGGNDVHLGDRPPAPGGPVLHLKVFSLMGGSDVKRGRRLTRAERRERKRLRREQRRSEHDER
ncbi:MAG TPA: DUF1707 domain-containing protein [Baekduia sp.]|uniref:DUF1707 SHOCT-like domain-containing protein n=1 Tax=Baekduia sp. TaxID=2600305 RepID=UPI002D781436|nr:DUF1707 domain-containing protein [Baekduia sp.]HET6505948.1 DUF1707 domain-containing protein [Baekduia sp.]